MTGYVATRDFEATDDDGTLMTFTRGRTHVAADHRILRTHRDDFEPESAYYERRHEQLRRAAERPGNREEPAEYARRVQRDPEIPLNAREAWNEARRSLETCVQDGRMTPDAADQVDDVLSRDADEFGVDSRYIAAVGDPAYERAFAKMLRYGPTAVLRMTTDEQQAVQAVTQADQMRAMVEGTGSAGGFGIPIAIDSSILMSSNGALNPWRDIATVRPMTTRELRLTTSDGVVAQYRVEGAESTDNSPTLAQPVLTANRADSFVPFTFELDQDWPSLREELRKLISDAKDVLEATKFATGSGTNEPQGVLTGLTTTQRVLTAATAAYALADGWSLKAAIPARFINQTTFAANPATWDSTYRFVGGNSAEPLQMASRDGDFLGRPKVEASALATGTTTGTKLIVGGDFKTGYVIGDRLGLSLEIIPHLFGAANRFPTGTRGAFAYWRNDGRVAVPNAFRYLEVK